MEFEFDKEMDAILRQARVGEVVTSTGTHMDADEISAFAENAVNEAARMRFTTHLADCARCRKILSNVITLNSEAETEAASSAVSTPVREVKTPWYRKLFAFPQLAYTMGAMVLLFSGFFGYLILQNLSSADRTVSYSTANKSAPQAAPYSASNSNTAANTSTTTTNSSGMMNTNATTTTTTTTTNSAPFSAANTNASTSTASTNTAQKKSTEPETDAPVTETQPMATPAPKSVTKDEDEKKLDVTRNEAQQSNRPSPAGAVREDNLKRDKKENTATLDGRSADDALSQEKAKTQRSAPEDKRKQPSKPGETRNVAGKTFNNIGGIWFDSAVGKQKQKTVNRGTSEYQKLDAGLRSIADQLGGTVVILWGSKAYRIQ